MRCFGWHKIPCQARSKIAQSSFLTASFTNSRSAVFKSKFATPMDGHAGLSFPSTILPKGKLLLSTCGTKAAKGN